tara:strand:+ start:1670 stop:2770 length:1101 start_codon:yes stop_codon:yes gene_type:complete
LINFFKISFFVILFLFLNNNILADSNIYLIKNNKITVFQNDILEARKVSKQKAFNIALEKLFERIVPQEEKDLFYKFDGMDLTKFISDYVIKKEDFFDEEYNAVIDVNFNAQEIQKLFEKFDINLNNSISEDFLVLPIYYHSNTYYFWEKNNGWYFSLKKNYDENELIKLFFPELKLLNKFKISYKEALEANRESLKKILLEYDKRSVVIIFLKEKYDFEFENFVSKVEIKIFTDDSFYELEVDETLKENISKKNEIDYLAFQTLKSLSKWWKSKITTKYKKNQEFNKYKILIEFEKVEQSVKILESLQKNPYVSKLIPKEISKKKIFYELLTYGSIDKLKLALKSSNLNLNFDEELEIFKVVKIK